MKKVNFSAGPSILPQFTLDKTAQASVDYVDGMSIMEISHRSKDFQAVIDEAFALFRELLSIPDNYSILFLGGGASLQFTMIPYNFLEKKAAYIDSGVWANKAIEEARMFGEVIEVASSKDKMYSYYPKNYTIPTDADYFHITTNNTIYGTELRKDIDSPIPLIADMSSDIFSRPMDVSKYHMIYGGAQKNLGPAGATFVIIRNDMVDKVTRQIPTMLNYKVHIESGSIYNTPPVLPIYVSLQTLKWLKSLGGLSVMEKMNIEKATLLYDEIDRNKFFKGATAVEDRSLMNVTFVMNDEYKDLEKDFFDFAIGRGMSSIKGHRSIGGFRTSIYNAMPKSGVQELVDCMKDFEKRH